MRAWETTNGTHMRVADLTPAQAVEATLGSDLQAENAKLRELLSELYESAWLEYPSAFEHTFGERLRKLGIEVDA